MTSTVLATNSLLPISIGKSGYPIYELMAPSAQNGYRHSTRIGLMPISRRGWEFLKERTSEGDLSESLEEFKALLEGGHLVSAEYPELLMVLPNSPTEVFLQHCPLPYFYNEGPVSEYVLMSVLSGSILTFWSMHSLYKTAEKFSFNFKPNDIVPSSSVYEKDKARMTQLSALKRQLCESVLNKEWKPGIEYYQIDINTLSADLADNIRALMAQVAEFDAKHSALLSAVASKLDEVSKLHGLSYLSQGGALISTSPHFWFKASMYDDETVAFAWESGSMLVKSSNMDTFAKVLAVLLLDTVPEVV